MQAAAAAALLALAGAALLMAQQSSETPAEGAAADPEPAADPAAGSWLESIVSTVAEAVRGNEGNRAAFLATIRRAETGTDGPGAYSIVVGGGRFSDFSTHPRVYVKQFNSTAAGAYQINWPTWSTEIVPAIKPADFSPASQDAAALYLLRKSGALAAIDAGQFAEAVRLAAPRWASLPGAGYGQHEQSFDFLANFYASKGGNVA